MTRAKITYVIGTLEVGGAERQLIELLKHLDRYRYSRSLVLFDGEAASRAEGLVDDTLNLNISAAANSHWLRKSAKVARAVSRLAVYLQQTKPDIVQAILPASTIITAAATMISRKPVLIGCRRSLAGAYRTTRLLSEVDKKATRRCDVVIGNSAAICRELELDGVPPNCTLQIPNGVDTQTFCPGSRSERQYYGWSEEHVVFGMMANFIPYKRHLDFIRAAQIIATSEPKARFLMVGEDRGVLTAAKHELERRGLQAVCTIISGSRQPERLYRAMDIYVCSSETEGLSNVLLEAGASGLPIIATKVGGNPEVVLDGYNGMLVAPHNPESIAEAGLALAANPTLRREMALRSREYVASSFSMDSMIVAYQNLYEKLLRQVASPPLSADKSLPVSMQS